MKKIWSVLIILCLIVSLLPLKIISTVNAESSFNYGEALQKAIMFYEFQRSGDLPEESRNNWRGDSALNDGDDVGLDLTGGWYDAGDHVKFNLPMAYSQTMLAWSVYEDRETLTQSGQLECMLDNIKWVSDYLMKCHPEANVFYYQVGDGNLDHSWWGPAEVMQMNRPSYKVDVTNPGSTVVGEAAAALASASVVFKQTDPDYSALCLKHAKELYTFADNTKSDKGYTAANGFYNSWSGFYDELSWSGVWLYIATGDLAYLKKAESYVSYWSSDSQTSTISYKWAHNWDDVHNGACLLLAKVTGKQLYKDSMEMHLDYWTTGYNGSKITYTPKGLAWLSEWGSLRYATTTAFLASVYADWEGCNDSKVDTYKKFAKKQVDYALGSTGRSFEVGFGTNSPQHPHHRTAQSSWADSQLIPNYHRHTIYGALVGGPGQDDSYTDSIGNYVNNEIACDYNAGFVGVLTKMYKWYGGNPISGFDAIEEKTNDEFFVEAGINSTGSNFIEIKALLNNRSGWPAKVGDKLSFKYFIDITEAINKGYTSNDITVTTNYNSGATVSKLLPWDEVNHIYYVNVDFTGTKIYPGGQSAYQKEIQFRIATPTGTNFWDNSNDFSFSEISGRINGSVIQTIFIPVYDDGVKVYGNEPGNTVNNSSISLHSTSFDKYLPSQGDISVDIIFNGNTFNGIKNGTYSLVEGTDYNISENIVTLKKEYLAKQSNGNMDVIFDFSSGNDSILTISIFDSSVVVTGKMKVQMYNANTSSATNGITPKFKLVNTGTSDVKLSDCTIRYYYTIDNEKNQNYWCDWSSVGSSNVTGTFVKMDNIKDGANYYFELGFKDAAGTLGAGQTCEVQIRFSKEDWTNYIQSNDYSFNATNTNYVDDEKVTVYLLKSLVWGVEP